MDTAERTTARESSTVYDGFISYSHAADDLLAPRLQSGLQRFAKPWWKRRALRIFRDESSLSANPHLWSSITEALDESGWFVLLLSPDAANSPWVNQEIEYWKEHKDPSRILPVLTDGTFQWSSGDVEGTAVPEQLQGAFSEEPRWVDMRFARDETDLDLKDPRFADAIADIASALRRVPKDELASEEVRQHRRTVRTAWAACVLVLLLGVAAVFAAIQASQNADEAQRQAEIAAQSAAAEADARADAEAAAEEAAQARAEAEREAAISRSRELSASAVAVLDQDPELSIMLAIESLEATPGGSTPSPEAVRTLRTAVLNHKLEMRLRGAGSYAHISPDGSTVYHIDTERNVVLGRDVASDSEIWVSDQISRGALGRIDVSPNGDTVTVQLHLPDSHQVLVFDARNGDLLHIIDPGDGCLGFDPEHSDLSAPGGFSPGGEWFTVFTGRSGCGSEPDEGWVAVYDASTWEEQSRLNTEDGTAFAASFSSDASRVLLSTFTRETAELRSFPELDLIATHPNAWTYVAISPDGERMAYLRGDRGPILADAETGEIIKSLSQTDEAFFGAEPFVFSPDGSKLIVPGATRDFGFDGHNGGFLGALGSTGLTVSTSFTDDGSRILTTTLGDALIWDFATGQTVESSEFSGNWINPEQATDGPVAAVTVMDFEAGPVLATLDAESGEVVDSRNGWGTQLADGRFVVANVFESGDGEVVGPLEVWDSHEDISKVLAGCSLSFPLEGEPPKCPNGGPFFGGAALGDPFPAVSDSARSAFAAKSLDSSSVVMVWDQANLALISRFEIPLNQTLVGMTDTWIVALEFDARGPRRDRGERLLIYDFDGNIVGEIEADPDSQFFGAVLFSNDRSLLIARDVGGSVSVYETGSWTRVLEWQAHDARIRGWSLSADGGRLATAGEAGTAYIWNISSVDSGEPPLAPESTIPVGVIASDVLWEADDRLLVFLIDRGPSARWFTAYLDTDDLVRDARERLTRGFSETECTTYRIENCPMTLEEIRRG
jgi:WD40 repeat protein